MNLPVTSNPLSTVPKRIKFSSDAALLPAQSRKRSMSQLSNLPLSLHPRKRYRQVDGCRYLSYEDTIAESSTEPTSFSSEH